MSWLGLISFPKQDAPSPAPHLKIPLDASRPTGTLAKLAPGSEPSAEQETPAMKIAGIFSDAVNWFSKVFKKAPAWNATALSALNTVAPEVEIALALIDPAAEQAAAPIITETQADLATIASALKQGNGANLSTFVSAIKTNFSQLLTAGHIKDPASVQKATAIFGSVSTVLDGILAQVPTSGQTGN